MHPEDTDATEDTLDIVTIDNALTDNLYNDLGIMVGNNRLLLLLEAQSSWTVNILKQYLSSKEVEVVTIMMSLFDNAQIMRTYTKDIEKETERKSAKRMIKDGELSLEKIARYVPALSMEELKEIEAKVMQLA